MAREIGVTYERKGMRERWHQRTFIYASSALRGLAPPTLSHEAGAACFVNTTVQLNTQVMRQAATRQKCYIHSQSITTRHGYVYDLCLRSA
jgi:hypothetical protein